jgi:hypothetical protein
MVYAQTFQNIKENIVKINSKNDESALVAQEVIKEFPYPTEGKHMYKGMRTNAPYANPKLEPGALYKMPGMRAKWADMVNKVWSKKVEYTALFVKGFVSLGISVLIFMQIPFPYSLSAFAFIFYGFWKLMVGHNVRLATYGFEMNMGYVGSLVYDGHYATKNDYWGKKQVLGK